MKWIMPYQIKYIKEKKRQGYAVMDGDRIINDWLFPNKKDAEKKRKLMEDWNR